MDARVERLAARVDLCAWRLRQGEDVRAAEVTALVDELAGVAGELSVEERACITLLTERLRSAVEDACTDIAGRIATLRRGRKVVRGYGVLRREDVGRRVRRRL